MFKFIFIIILLVIGYRLFTNTASIGPSQKQDQIDKDQEYSDYEEVD